MEQNLLEALSKTSFPKSHFLKGQEGGWEQAVWTYQGQMVPDCLLGKLVIRAGWQQCIC